MLVFPLLCNSLPEGGGAEVIIVDPTAGRCLPAGLFVFLSDLPPRPKTGTFLEGHKGSIDHIKMGISVMPYIYGIGYSHINDGIYGIDGIYIYDIPIYNIPGG
jgi:hypothetical protein